MWTSYWTHFPKARCVSVMQADVRPIYFIHGWGVGPGIWEAFIKALNYQGQAYTLGLPGYDVKPKQRKYKKLNIDGIVEQLADQISADAILVGWSLGGMIAIKLAEYKKHLINTLVLLASTPCFVKKPDWPQGVDATRLRSIASNLKHDQDGVLKTFISETAIGDPSPKVTIRKLQESAQQGSQYFETLSDGLEILENEDLRHNMKNLACQTGMILGKNDRLIPVATGEYVLRSCPDISLVTIDNAGHAPFVSQQQSTITAIKRLISDNQS